MKLGFGATAQAECKPSPFAILQLALKRSAR